MKKILFGLSLGLVLGIGSTTYGAMIISPNTPGMPTARVVVLAPAINNAPSIQEQPIGSSLRGVPESGKDQALELRIIRLERRVKLLEAKKK